MASRRFKLKFTLPSFHFCRSKRPSSFPKCPAPAATYLFSPLNPKSLEISYPTFPDPPPSTPNHSTSKFISLIPQKIHNSPTSFDPDCKSPIKQPKSENKKENKKRNNSKTKSKSKSKVCASISSGDSVWFSSEDEKEIENTFSFSTSFDSSLETINESPSNEDRKNHSKSNKKNNKKNNNNNANLRARRLRRYVSYSWRTVSSESESDLPAKKSSAAEGKVKESFAVVKRSEDPYEDFKRSMLEMILEKQMFKAKDLEQLLECFLSLNSKQHHEVIVQAFSEIWTDLFC